VEQPFDPLIRRASIEGLLRVLTASMSLDTTSVNRFEGHR
jgi:hypothetical protein